MRVLVGILCFGLGLAGCVSNSSGRPSLGSAATDATADGVAQLPDGGTTTAGGDVIPASDTPIGGPDGGPDGDQDSAAPTDTIPSDTPATAETTADTTPAGCQSPADCDDNDYCSTDTCKPDGTCAHAPIANCVPPQLPCNATNPCKAGVCDPATNACAVCLTTADCPKGSLCQGKQCKPAQACKSDIDCKATKQVCGAATGLCVDCNSGLDCATGEACVDSKCVGAAPCKSSKDCPAVCNQPKGICVECVTADDCAAGKFCAADGKCAQAVCLGPACGSANWLFVCKADGSAYQTGVTCDDGEPCTDSGCSGSKGCHKVDNAAPCNDNSVCTEGDACAGGKCTGKKLVCDDANPCTDDLCDATAGCKYLSNTGKCDDNSTCTQNDNCTGGACKGQGVNCDDGNPCTTDDCDSKQACLHFNNAAACTDGNTCTEGDACKDGKCGAGATKACNDSNTCTSDSCDPKAGCKYLFVAAGTACDDGSQCTFNDACTAGGKCAGAGGNCDDQNPCTDNTCDPKGGCLFPANTLPCDDKNPCTGGDKCGNGKCQAGAGAPCDDGNPCTDQGCDTAKGGCYFTSNTAKCEDGNACTAGDACANGKCAKGGTLLCDDKNGCTSDSCDVVKGCVFQVAGACDDGDPCTTDSCNPANGACNHVAVANCCAAGAVLYSQSFDSGPPVELGITNSTGLAKKGWQVWEPAYKSVSPKGVLYYGDPAVATFDFGKSDGKATFTLGNLPPKGKQSVEFQMSYEAEKYVDYDMLTVSWEATGKSAQTLWTKKSLGTYNCASASNTYTCANLPTGWAKVSVAVPAGYTTGAKLVLTFDTVDNQHNNTLGVLIDDLQVIQASCN